MTKTLISAVLLSAFISQAALAASSSAQIDWSTFSVELVDLDTLDGTAPSINWTSKYSWASVTDEAVRDEAPSWTTGVQAAYGTSLAVVNDTSNYAETSTVFGSPFLQYGLAERGGYFELSQNTSAIFKVSGKYATQVDNPDETISAWIGLFVSGPGEEGSGTQFDGATIGWNGYVYTPHSDEGTIAVTFTNLSSSSLSGRLHTEAYASAYVAAVPEPESYAMLLAGLSLMGLVVRRRI
ncbi:PEP-CTERM sorting domain-containing protein [Nitrogeniibacter mangrovi]|uniref:PEP-CTERM sorting domain-containing protein n=1 Tax=Nitrogeniibacter mangrovi TaxID=2016596 RepID=UPI001C2CF5A0|nr:PEP-CTERM sorting domain-containing protein [Nitrogeniibacter mangrovi]